ncbi:unnamed protein product, partial [Rotaria magnacalcarata]
AEEYMEIVEKKGHEALNKLSSRKKRALEQLGCLSDVKNMSPQVLKEKVSNLNGESIENLIKQHGDNVKIAIRNGKLYAVLPTYKEYMDNIEPGIYAGPMHFKLAAEKFKAPIEVLDPENGFQLHADAPDGEGDVGHFAPVIEVNGELRVANINQDVDTTDQCFTQTMLFIEKYNAGTIKDIDFDEHVAHGSRAKKKSSWVSASRSIKVAGAWASENKRFVAEFDVPFEENLPYEERSVFDLTDPSTQNYVFGSGLSMPKNFGKSSQEIVIKGGVDASKIRQIYSTRRVTEEEYKTLKS